MSNDNSVNGAGGPGETIVQEGVRAVVDGDRAGLRFDRYFTDAAVHPYDEVEWELRDAVISDWKTGDIAFEQRGVEFPTSWSMIATNIVSQKYFRGTLGTESRERSVRQMIDRVADTITGWGIADGYFADTPSAETFNAELKHLLIHQKAAFNSPVWFNCGVEETPQCSACFILSVEDKMSSILNWYVEEGTIFKGGSGSGVNLSSIRSSVEILKGGGEASGPVSFMRGADASAGTIKSGGKTRRAAKMVILNVDHPDIEEFIWCKQREEEKSRALQAAGFDMSLDGADSASVQYQNANNSVRVSDEFMQAVVEDADFHLREVLTGKVAKTMPARELMGQIAEAAWACADPGIQYDTTINDWHTTPNAGPINGSNPCSEYMHLDNSACNLASLNLRKFEAGGVFDVEAFRRAVEVVFTAQEIIVGNSSYPTKAIGENAVRYRQLGMGYANLGGMLMSLGLPYDSDEGRAWAGTITALMTGHAYRTSAEIARVTGAFEGYADDSDGTLRVLRKHRAAVGSIDASKAPANILAAAQDSWDTCIEVAEGHGVRNAQATVLAPTGCLVGGSLVATDRGLVRLRSLGDPGGQQWQDADLMVATDEGPRQATKFYVNGSEGVVTVQTKRGYTIRGTAQHRIKVLDGEGRWVWTRFGDLAGGERVPLSLGGLVGQPQEVTLPPLGEGHWNSEWDTVVPRTMDVELAEFLGYFMGDGSLHAKGIRLCVADGDVDVVDRLRLLGKQLFNLETHTTAQQGYTELAFHSVRLVEWWEACGFAKHSPRPGHRGKGWESHIPDAVLHTNDRTIYAAFLRGLYEADGTVTNGYPTWSTTSEQFSQDVQTVLLTLGYPTTRKFDMPGWGSKPLAVLRLLNIGSAAGWNDEVGFLSARKSQGVQTSASQQSARHDKIPVDTDLVNRLVPENSAVRRNLLQDVRRTGSISRRAAADLLARTDDATLAHLLGFFYDEVARAELGDDDLTYDLSVPDNVTYVAGGFISHNTIGLMMDCDTTGIEPDLGLVKSKKLVGGGTMRIVNQTVPSALANLGYLPEQVEAIVAYIDTHATGEGAPALREEHIPVFDCAMGDRSIAPGGHIKMMAAAQPFLSGAISKTVNLPETATVKDVQDLYIDGWRLGLKAIAIYRDNCKVAQPLSIDSKKSRDKDAADALAASAPAATTAEAGIVRRRLPKQRPSQTISFQVGDADGYLTAGEYPGDGLGEIFVKLGKQGSTLSGIMDALAISVSVGLQYGVPLEAFVSKFINTRYEPAGMTDDPDVRFATSLTDYMFRKLAIEYLPAEQRQSMGIYTTEERNAELDGTYGAPAQSVPEVEEPVADATGQTVLPVEDHPHPVDDIYGDAPLCLQCGSKMQRAGSCHVCPGCGTTSGCS
ncbi:hypothetical protein BH23ACT9_BH23ACT9_31440 [soil metagenome]